MKALKSLILIIIFLMLAGCGQQGTGKCACKKCYAPAESGKSYCSNHRYGCY